MNIRRDQHNDLFAQLPIPAILLDTANLVVSANRRMEAACLEMDIDLDSFTIDTLLLQTGAPVAGRLAEIRGGEAPRTEFTCLLKHGDPPFRRFRAFVAPLEGGGPGELIVQLLDIEQRERGDDKLKNYAARFSALIRNLQSGILVEDESRHIVLTNKRLTEMFAIPAPPEQLIGADCSNAAEESKDFFIDPQAFVDRIAELLSAKELALGDILRLRDGRVLQRDYVPVFSGETYLGHMWVYDDVTERERAREELERLATDDPLTGAANRRELMRRMREEYVRSARSGEPFALLLLDLDHFKQINDTYGHQIGDEVLKGVVALLRGILRETDTVARYGGEEFAILMPGTGNEAMQDGAERLRAAIENSDWEPAAVTASFGGVAITSHYTTDLDDDEIVRRLTDHLSEADKALYSAKKVGRNRCRFAK